MTKPYIYPKLVVPNGEIARLFKDIDQSGCLGAIPVPKQSEENTHSKKASQQHNTQEQETREKHRSHKVKHSKEP